MSAIETRVLYSRSIGLIMLTPLSPDNRESDFKRFRNKQVSTLNSEHFQLTSITDENNSDYIRLRRQFGTNIRISIRESLDVPIRGDNGRAGYDTSS